METLLTLQEVFAFVQNEESCRSAMLLVPSTYRYALVSACLVVKILWVGLTLLKNPKSGVIIATVQNILELPVGVFMVIYRGHVGVVLAVIFGLLEAMGSNLVLTILRLLILQTPGSLLHLDHLLQPPYLP